MKPLRSVRLTAIFALVLPLSYSQAQNGFVAKGAPAPDREWVGHDYISLATALQSGAIPLPTRSTADGREIFERIVNRENFGFYQNKLIPVQQRLGSFMQLMQGLNAILALYTTEANKGRKVATEVTELMSMILYSSVVMLDALDEFIASVPADPAKRSERDAGLKQVRGGAVHIVQGAEASLSERTFYSKSDLSALLKAMAETFGRLTADFTQNQRTELRVRLANRKKDFSSGPDSERLDALIRMLDPSSPKPAPK